LLHNPSGRFVFRSLPEALRLIFGNTLFSQLMMSPW